MDSQLGLFSSEQAESRPLAAQFRPMAWEDFYGQENVIGQLQNLNLKNLPHIVFHGPPGCGKTTLAGLLASKSELTMYKFNAVLGGVSELREIIKTAEKKSTNEGTKSIIFIDEIHRFNKAQQDALLPYLEDKTFILFGATTENPRTTLNKAIISRVSLMRMQALGSLEVQAILKSIAEAKNFNIQEELLQFISDNSSGDARFAINQLEALIENKDRIQELTAEDIAKNFLKVNRQYDKNQDRHYDVISAFIKSVRGSDPDAAILWLAVMLEGGEDVEFIARRLLILASEDIGNADPRALNIAHSTHYTVSKIGMPEARIPLAQATIYLAQAPKSNASYRAIDLALDYVRSNPTIEVPNHLRNHHPEKRNYKYPHAYPKHWVKQEHLPSLKTSLFYNSSEQGYERTINEYQKKIKND